MSDTVYHPAQNEAFTGDSYYAELKPGRDLLPFNVLADSSYENSHKHGFYEDLEFHKSIEALRSYIGNKMMLIVGEAAEAHEEHRSGHHPQEIYFNRDSDKPDKPEGIPAELADIIIRVMDFCGWQDIDIEHAIALKAQYNLSRPYKHGRTM